MDSDTWIALAGVATAGTGILVTVLFRFLRDRHANLRREWSVLQSLADELRMNWALIRLESPRPMHAAWLSAVRDRYWIPVKTNDYYDLLSLYAALVKVADTAREGGLRRARARFQELEPWVAAWWSHLQSEADRWRDRIDTWWSRKDMWLTDTWWWWKWLISRAPARSRGPACWPAEFRPADAYNFRLSRRPSDVRQVVLGELSDRKPWAQSIRSRVVARQSRRRNPLLRLPWSPCVR
jgi:hypothetical protein